jgi:pimeloyl-ACP methyl ester carboxylesterase
MKYFRLIFLICFCGCAPAWRAPSDFIGASINAGKYTIVTFQRITDAVSPIHIYIEGDGNSFDAHGRPTSDPTPRSTFMRDLAARDSSPNVIYMARPCQYIKSSACSRIDWTSGRFSQDMIKSVSSAIKQIAGNAPVVLIGYSGGAMVSGLIAQNYPEITVRQWITIAGVLNHTEWTEYFKDAPLSMSLNLNGLPDVPQVHYIARGDRVVPNSLSRKWTDGKKLIVIDGATHNNFPALNLF